MKKPAGAGFQKQADIDLQAHANNIAGGVINIGSCQRHIAARVVGGNHTHRAGVRVAIIHRGVELLGEFAKDALRADDIRALSNLADVGILFRFDSYCLPP